jgi:glycerol-3-phosphate acyltransferase PlsY
MESTISLIIVIVLSYLIGSIPTAIIISKLFFGFDLRDKGSGNMGSTNAFRVLGAKWGVVVQLLDILKGVVPVVFVATMFKVDYNFGSNYFESITIVKMIAGVSAVAGHIWTVFADFRGGKGVNTIAGMLFAIAPIEISISIGIFFIAVFFSGYISLGSIVGTMSLPVSLFFRHNVFMADTPGYGILIYFLISLPLLVIITHRKNIARLFNGTENRFEKLHLIKLNSKQK